MTTCLIPSARLQLIERAGHAAEEEKVEQKMADSWEELSLVSASPTLIRKGIEGVVKKHVAKAEKQQKGIDYLRKISCTQRFTNTTSVTLFEWFSF